MSAKVVYFSSFALLVVLVAGLASGSATDTPNVAQDQAKASSVEYAQHQVEDTRQVASSLVSDRLGALDGLLESSGLEGASEEGAEKSKKKEPTCSCAGTKAAEAEAVDAEVNVKKTSKIAKKATKKYKVITISMPDDDGADADAIIETKVDEQPEQQVAKKQQQPESPEKESKAEEASALLEDMPEMGQVEEEEQQQQQQEETTVKPAKEGNKNKSKGHKKADKKTLDNKRSKREAQGEKKRSKRDSKQSKRSSSSSSSKDAKSKRNEYQKKAKKDKK